MRIKAWSRRLTPTTTLANCFAAFGHNHGAPDRRVAEARVIRKAESFEYSA